MEAEPEILGADHVTVAAATARRREQSRDRSAVRQDRGRDRRGGRRRAAPHDATVPCAGAGRRAAQADRYLRFQIAEIPAWMTFTRGGPTADHEHAAPGLGDGVAAIAHLRGAWVADPFFCFIPRGSRARAAG